jgi:putative transposase
VWLYHRFPLSFREVEELMLQRGVVVSYETIRQWCAKFGQVYATRLRRRRARPGDKWHLDEVFIRINGTIHYRRRTVDQHGAIAAMSRRGRTQGSRMSAALGGDISVTSGTVCPGGGVPPAQH